MTYGIYTRDKKSMFLSGLPSIDECRKCQCLWRDTDVVCSEKRYLSSWGISIKFHKWMGLHYWKYDERYILGFMSFEIHSNYYTWADKIVYDPKKEGDEK